MGCLQSSSEKDPPPSPMKEPEAPQKVDPRLPFDSYRQLFNTKNSWKAVSRALESTSKECLMRLFKAHPEHKAMHPKLAGMDEEEMAKSTDFEETALEVFNVIDDAMGTIDRVDMTMMTLQEAGKQHARIPGFQATYFKDMEEPFIEAIKETLGERFREQTETNFRLLFGFIVEQLTLGYSAAGGQMGATEANQV